MVLVEKKNPTMLELAYDALRTTIPLAMFMTSSTRELQPQSLLLPPPPPNYYPRGQCSGSVNHHGYLTTRKVNRSLGEP